MNLNRFIAFIQEKKFKKKKKNLFLNLCNKIRGEKVLLGDYVTLKIT